MATQPAGAAGQDVSEGLALRYARGVLSLVLQAVERALDLMEPGLGEVGVDGGGVEALVAEERLDDTQVGAALDEVGGEGVAERTGGDALVHTRALPRQAEGALDAGGVDRLTGCLPSSK